MRSLSKNESRALAIGLLVLLLSMIALLLFIPVSILHRHYDQAIESQTDYLTRYLRLAATRGEIQIALDQVRKGDGRKHFLKNIGAALAASDIQGLAKALIEENGGRLNSMQVAPFKDEGRYRRITVNILMISSMPTLRKILYTFETMQPYLLVDNLSIISQVNVLYKEAPGVEPEMTVQFDLSGYALVAGKQ